MSHTLSVLSCHSTSIPVSLTLSWSRESKVFHQKITIIFPYPPSFAVMSCPSAFSAVRNVPATASTYTKTLFVQSSLLSTKASWVTPEAVRVEQWTQTESTYHERQFVVCRQKCVKFLHTLSPFFLQRFSPFEEPASVFAYSQLRLPPLMMSCE